MKKYKVLLNGVICAIVVTISIVSAVRIKERKVLDKYIEENVHMFDSLNQIFDSLRVVNVPPHYPDCPPFPNPKIDTSAFFKRLDSCLPCVYFIQTTYFDVTLPDGSFVQLTCGKDKVPVWTGSGFLLNNGKFVTARHVVEAWYFWQDGEGANENLAMLNAICNNGGKVVVHLVAVSSGGSRIELSSDKFRIDRSHDQYGKTDDGTKLSLAAIDDTDYAYTSVGNTSGGLAFDAEKSCNLNRGEELTILGFPSGLRIDAEKVNPLFGSTNVASTRLEDDILLTTSTSYDDEHGTSGGPIFSNSVSEEFVVIGMWLKRGKVLPINVVNDNI